MRKFSVVLEGKTPLILNRNAMDEDRTVTGGKPGDDRYPADMWKSRLYLTEHVTLPEANVKAAMEKAGGMIKIGSNKTLKQAAVSGIYIDDPYPVLLVDGKKITRAQIDAVDGKTFEEQVEQAKVLGIEPFVAVVQRKSGAAKVSNVRVRPRFAHWSMRFGIELEDEFWPEDRQKDTTIDRLRQLFTAAGARVGFGDWRPGSPRPGSHGRFTAAVNAIAE